MLALFTSLTDFLGMSVALWLAAYILARGFPRQATFRGAAVLFIISAFFFLAYLNLHERFQEWAIWQAVITVTGLIAWYELTYQLLPVFERGKMRWLAWGVYALGLATVVVLISQRAAFRPEPGEPLDVPRLASRLAYFVYAFEIVSIGATLYNFRVAAHVSLSIGPHSRYTWAASLMGAGALAYGFAAGLLPWPMPRLPMDGLLFGSTLLLGYSVARRQIFVERRTALHDMPIAGLAIFSLCSVYVLAAWQLGMPPAQLASVTALAIMTHSAYDIVHEFLHRLVNRHESVLRQQLRQLAREVSDEAALSDLLKHGLSGLCRALNATGGFIAVKRGDDFVVAASQHSLEIGQAVGWSPPGGDDVWPPPPPLSARVAWLGLGFIGDDPRAMVGVGPRANRSHYLDDDLDFIAEMADLVGRIVYALEQREASRDRLRQLVSEVRARETEVQGEAQALIAAGEVKVEARFVNAVEDGLRNLADYSALGQSPLAAHLQLPSASHIERGKAMRTCLIQAIESLRPAQPRPTEVLPREWHGYAILHDAYVADVPNREIMARLYISEGTFNRQRRKALHAVARTLLETADFAGLSPP